MIGWSGWVMGREGFGFGLHSEAFIGIRQGALCGVVRILTLGK
jgi:hypothetical protein